MNAARLLLFIALPILAAAWAVAERLVARETLRAFRAVPRPRWREALPAAYCLLADSAVLACALRNAFANPSSWSALSFPEAVAVLLFPLSLLPGFFTACCLAAACVVAGFPDAFSCRPLPVVAFAVFLLLGPFGRCRLLRRSAAPARWKTLLVLFTAHLPVLPLVPFSLTR
ncbi:MAG: hypothetical protein IJS32_06695 [Kiritimatiellae bacterium]|nr:hypothetical protein [Kiritimatiellia bacterium]